MRPLLLIIGVILLLRLPFLDQAVQGDDIYYLAGAQHAQIDPAHPNHARYVFLGQWVDMRGHPHPPLNAWFLAGLLALAGDIREVPFHTAYALFSLIAALAMWSLAKRFAPRPVEATLLLLATPAFVVNGNSLESDVPLLALWPASMALFVSAVDRRSTGRLAASAIALTLTALTAYQSVLLVPILAVYLWMKQRNWRIAWLAVLAVPLVLAAWQLWERAATGEMPAAVLNRYFHEYGLQELSQKLRNAAALTGHAAWIVFPVLAVAAVRRAPRVAWIAAGAGAAGAELVDSHPLFWASFGIGVLLVASCAARLRRGGEQDERFLAAWVLLFFAGALVLFFAGSARYLLPAAAPVALLVTRSFRYRTRWLAAGIALQFALSLALAFVNYQHWDGYRQFASQLRRETESRRVWINGEWGLRFYFEADGGLPLERGQAVDPGDMVVSSDLAFPLRYTTGGGALAPFAGAEIRTSLPLRLVGLGNRSAWSSAAFGLRPFDISTGPIDRVRAQVVIERKPEVSWLPMNAPEAERQIASGVYELEGGRWRWMSDRAVFLLKRPAAPSVVAVAFHIPEQAPARRVALWVDGAKVAEKVFPTPGTYTLVSGPVTVAGESATIMVNVDKAFSVPGDHRRLGIILSEIGFREAR